MPLVPDPPGGTAYVYTALANLINASWALAETQRTDLNDKLAAITGASGWLATTSAPHITAGTATTPSVTEPSVSIPTAVDSTAIMDLFDTKYIELIDELVTRFTAFRTSYFPDESAAYTAAENWLQDALANPQAGLPVAVQNQIFGDDRDRIVADAARASEDAIAVFATRRYPLPSGVSAAVVADIQQKAQQEISASSRKVALVSVEQLRFVVEKTLSLRQIAMASAIDYVKALASGPDVASGLINVGYDAQSKLISAASSFYNSRIAAAELVGKTSQYNVSATLQAAEKNQAADMGIIEDRLKALLAEISSIASMATSLYNNLHANASASGSDSVSTFL